MTRASALAEEADRATIALQIALARLGVQTIAEALQLWGRMSPQQVARTRDAWLGDAIQLILSRRYQTQAVAVAYYRLARALRTGSTVRAPGEPAARYITLQRLRAEFARLTEDLVDADEIDATIERSRQELDTPPRRGEYHPDDDFEIDLDRIEIEDIDDIRDLVDELDDAVIEEAEVVLDANGPENLQKKLEEIARKEQRAEERGRDYDAEAARNEAHEAVGRKQAATVERLATNGARSAVWQMNEGDQRVIGWVRFSATGTPCGWCAMLISRGLNLKTGRVRAYRSAATAAYSDGDKYHDNCRCIAIPIYSHSHFETSPLFDLNKEYARLWPEVTKGLGGKDALREWRRFIRQRRSSLNIRSEQDSESSTIAQEA